MRTLTRQFGCIAAIATLSAGAALSAGETKDPGAETRKALLRTRVLDHFIIGIDAPTEWMNETRDKNGAHWDFRAQYVSGGAAKAHSWDTVFLDPWNQWVNPKKEHGAWVELYLSKTLEAGYMPWITFYNLAQSMPADYKPGPALATPANAKNKETMTAYFEQFMLLMKVCGRHAPNPIVVQLEPDEWGHLLLSGKHEGKQLDPATVDIKVGSTGLSDLAGLPDNLIGYAQGLKRLRDTYAPNNVLLACNPSGWDSQGSMSGKKFAEYLLKCGCGDWELAVFETSDRDKGMSGQAPPYDEKIGITGSLENHIHWIDEFHKTSGLYVVVWQVAVGNTYYACCNNTPGHYCDNIAQMLFEDYPKNPTISRYVQAGCAGFVFNPGQGDCTHPFDERKDGFTDPPPIPGNLGHKSDFADDDGGYMRLRVGNYYKQPFPILGKLAAPVTDVSDPAARKAAAAPPAAPPKPAPVVLKLVDTAARDAWKSKLMEQVLKRIEAGRAPAFELSAFHENAKIATCDAQGRITLNLQNNGKIDYTWEQLNAADFASLAMGLAQDDDNENRAMAAFFCLWASKPELAKHYFEKAPECEAKVRAAFAE